MNSVFHARSSARRFGGVWNDYQSLHRFLDSSKSVFASVPHRLYLHTTDLGRALLKMRFGDTVRNADGADVPVDAIMDQHLDEDFYFMPTLDNWLERAAIPEIRVSKDGIVTTRISGRAAMRRRVPGDVLPYLENPLAGAVARFGGDRPDFEPLLAFFDLPSQFSAVPGANAVLENSFGIFLAEDIFGPVLSLSDAREVPTRIVAEKFVCARRGSIPSASALPASLALEEWMIGDRDERLHPAA